MDELKSLFLANPTPSLLVIFGLIAAAIVTIFLAGPLLVGGI